MCVATKILPHGSHTHATLKGEKKLLKIDYMKQVLKESKAAERHVTLKHVVVKTGTELRNACSVWRYSTIVYFRLTGDNKFGQQFIRYMQQFGYAETQHPTRCSTDFSAPSAQIRAQTRTHAPAHTEQNKKIVPVGHPFCCLEFCTNTSAQILVWGLLRPPLRGAWRISNNCAPPLLRL